jgi:DNA gyrase subunit A
VDDNNIELTELLYVVKGPDFPTGGIILGTNGIKSAYATGRGTIIMRGQTQIEEQNNKRAIIITEMPYMVNKAKLVEKIADLVREKRIEGISDLRDESNKSGVRVVIELKRDAIADLILSQIYSYTSLQTTFGVIMLALKDGMPKVMNLKEIIAAFVHFREIVITRRTIYLLNKARDRAHILLGLRIGASNIDEIIRIIKSSSDPIEAKEQLMKRSWDVNDIIALIKLVDDKAVISNQNQCNFTEVQAKAILEMRLQRLTAMEKNKLEADLTNLAQEIAGYIAILGTRETLLEILKNELLAVKNEFATERLTFIEEGGFEQDIEDLIQREEMVVTVTLGGYIKRVPLVTYKAQRRGGKGRSGLSMRDEDVTTQIFVGSTHTLMLFFSNIGQVYSLKLYKLPLGNPQSRGRPIINILPLKANEHITNIMSLPENQEEWDNLNLMFATSKGNVRRNDLSDFKSIQSNGKIAIRLDENDSLIDVKVCSESDHILLATKAGKAIRFSADEVRLFKSRTSDGVRGMRLAASDQVISMTVLKGMISNLEERESYLSIPLETRLNIALGKEWTPNQCETELSVEQIVTMAKSEEFILTISENGIGKRSSAYEYRMAHRGGMGVINMDISDKTGQVVAVMPASVAHELMLITNYGKLIRCELKFVRSTGRNTQGVILFKLESEEKVVSASLIGDCSESLIALDDDSILEDI